MRLKIISVAVLILILLLSLLLFSSRQCANQTLDPQNEKYDFQNLCSIEKKLEYSEYLAQQNLLLEKTRKEVKSLIGDPDEESDLALYYLIQKSFGISELYLRVKFNEAGKSVEAQVLQN